MENPCLTEVLATLARVELRLVEVETEFATHKTAHESLKTAHESLKTAHESSQAENEKLKTDNERLQRRIGQQQEIIAGLQKQIFGSTSEKEKKGKGSPGRKPKGTGRHEHGRGPINQNLPQDELIIDVDPVMRPGLSLIGEEIHYRYRWIKGHWRVTRIVLLKYANPDKPQDGVVCATMPSLGMARSLFDSSFAARLIYNKYILHLPINRQMQQFDSEGLSIPYQTAVGHAMRVAILFRPLINCLYKEICASPAVHADDTPVDMLDPDNERGPGKKQCRTARIWTIVSDCNGPRLVIFIATGSRSKDDAWKVLGKLKAQYIHADACASHDCLFAPREDGTPAPQECACYAHVRRKFFEASESAGKQHTATILKIIGRLYAIEDEIRPQYQAAAAAADTPQQWQAAADLRRDYRLNQGAKALIDKLLVEIDAVLAKQVPGTLVHQAATYAANLRLQLFTYLEHGCLEIDNNKAENALRSVAVGRDNWLFFGSELGAEAGAIFMTLAANCKIHGINLDDYIRDVLPRLKNHPPERLHELLPHNWKPSPTS
jgi:transposase